MGKKDENDDTLSPFDEDISKFFDRASSFTKRLVGHTYDLTNELPTFWKDDESSMNDSIDDYINTPYQSHKNDWFGGNRSVPFGLPFPLFNAFGGFGDTPFGLHSYSSPSARKYNECMRKDGESLWDSEGNWRCLFPNSEVANKFLEYKRSHLANQILTKEDLQDAINENPGADSKATGMYDLGPKGIFFKEFNAYLNWKNTMLENVRKQREESRKKLRENAQSKFGDTSGNINFADSPGDMNEVVSYSLNTVTNFEPDTNEEIMKETRTEVYKDGRKVTKYTTKSRPFGSKEWISTSEDEDHTAGKAGWLWNSK